MATGVEALLQSLSTAITIITIVWSLYMASRIYGNIVMAHRKDNHVEFIYDNCTIYEAEEKHRR